LASALPPTPQDFVAITPMAETTSSAFLLITSAIFVNIETRESFLSWFKGISLNWKKCPRHRSLGHITTQNNEAK